MKDENTLMNKLKELQTIRAQSDANSVKLDTQGPDSRREVCLNCAIAVLEFILK